MNISNFVIQILTMSKFSRQTLATSYCYFISLKVYRVPFIKATNSILQNSVPRLFLFVPAIRDVGVCDA